MASDMPNNRHGVYPAYLSTQLGHQLDLAVSHGHHIGHQPDAMGSVMNQFSTLALPTGPNMPATSNMSQVQAHHVYCAAQDQPIAYQSYSVPPHVGMAPETTYSFGMSGQFPVQSSFAPLPVPYHATPYTSDRLPYGDRNSEVVPGLENRRGSYSTTESTPATPFFGSASERGSAQRVAVFRSSYTTPSPEQVALPGAVPKSCQPINEDLLALLNQHPPIPEAVPAVFTPQTLTKSIEQCLENRIHGNRNVYIRGLHPTTDDELLHQYASRFGKVEQSKAIIDTSTGACKGFGFAKFADVRDSEKCIRGFYHLGYEVGFARESFNARLKAEGDDNSTNLYLSNLPKCLNESELNAIFSGYHVVSSKILRDSMGNSRGVGFARFETREECEDIIKKYHGASIGEEGMLMQVRYADTPAQKELKRITAERRQFRTNEYNIGAYGTADVGIHTSIYHPAPWGRRAVAGSNTPFAPRVPIRHKVSGSVGVSSPIFQGMDRTIKYSTQAPGAASSDDGSAAEGDVAIPDSLMLNRGSTQSSPTFKKEKP
ncbi:Sporulation-specific protein 5 [Madurella mycetomatis]|uniref:Sporulation-specific protein 5 n=1 Tax=Madurella mycetomatis TaxID=100816 RepID=A0A175W2D4_9PEZI|nr:Sporulation-specific protein 5 [Madurella mycetomatis]